MKRNPFKAREYWREDTTWGEVIKGKMSKEEIEKKYCKKIDGEIDPYTSMRLNKGERRSIKELMKEF